MGATIGWGAEAELVRPSRCTANGKSSCSRGRRRAVVAQADAQICNLVNTFVSSDILDSLIEALIKPDSSTAGAEYKAAAKVGEWCKAQVADMGGRRLAEDQWDNYSAFVGDKDPRTTMEDEEYLDLIREKLVKIENLMMGRQQRDIEAPLPDGMWGQCTGYAFATATLISQLGAARAHAAASFILNNRGTTDDKIEGCGAIVNSVNSAIENGEIEGLSMAEIDADEMIVVEESVGKALGLTSVVAMIGGVAQTVYLLMEKCHSYDAMAVVV